jgi:Uma2 family endonuclease
MPGDIKDVCGGEAMATVQTKLMTVGRFYKWANRPDNTDRRYELDEGKVVEMPPPGEYHGALCAFIVHLLWTYVLRRGRGYVCCNDTGLVIKRKPATVRGPDIMLFDKSRSKRKLSRKFAAHVPKLVVEVLSPGDTMAKMLRRISQFLERGVPLVWLVDPENETVTVYRPGKAHYMVHTSESLTGEDVLPGLRYRVEDIFALPEE